MKDLLDTNIKAKVAKILAFDYEARDNDNRLLTLIWRSESKHNSLETFFSELSNGKLSNFESIRRVRQKLQEERPYLRGDKYLYRQTRSEQIRKNITKCNDTLEFLGDSTYFDMDEELINRKNPVSILSFVNEKGLKKVILFLIEKNPNKENKIITINNQHFLVSFNLKKYAYEFFLL